MDEAARQTRIREDLARRDREVLSVDDLKTYFYTDRGTVKAVDGVSFGLRRGEIMALVGESGSGKSVTALSIMRLVGPPGKILHGSVTLDGSMNLLHTSEAEMREYRGGRIAMVFQNPLTSLDPVYRIEAQLIETLQAHSRLSTQDARKRLLQTLRDLGVADAELVAASYPHQLGAGMRQRVAIAMALLSDPDVLIADEPTTNLDALEQAQVLMLLRDIKDRFGMAILLVTHDFGVVATFADRITVMYAGKIAEAGPKDKILTQALHPYTQALIESVPLIGKKVDKLSQIEGQMVNPAELPAGCSFNPRCPIAIDECRGVDPELVEVSDDHWVRCLVRAPGE